MKIKQFGTHNAAQTEADKLHKDSGLDCRADWASLVGWYVWTCTHDSRLLYLCDDNKWRELCQIAY
jgi:hypothetical protein